MGNPQSTQRCTGSARGNRVRSSTSGEEASGKKSWITLAWQPSTVDIGGLRKARCSNMVAQRVSSWGQRKTPVRPRSRAPSSCSGLGEGRSQRHHRCRGVSACYSIERTEADHPNATTVTTETKEHDLPTRRAFALMMANFTKSFEVR